MHATLIGARSLRALVLLSSLLPWACCALELLLLVFSVRFQQKNAVAQVHHHAAAPPRSAAAVRRVCQYSGLVRPATCDL